MPVKSTKKKDRALRVGIIGLGGIVQTTHLPILKGMDDIEVHAVCDSNEQKASWVSEKFHVPNVYTDVDRIVMSEEIDAVIISTPNNLHYPMATRALKTGKAVFIEKPVAKNLKETIALSKLAKSTGKLVMVGMNQRFRQDVEILKNFVDSGELGEVFYVKSGWMIHRAILDRNRWYYRKKVSGGGVLIDLGVQLFDLCLWINGNPALKSVSCNMFNKASGLEVEDSAAVQLVCAGGETINVEVTWSLMTEKEVTYTNIFGTDGGALLNPLRIHKELAGNLVNVTPDKPIDRKQIRKSYENELQHFADCLLSGIKCRSSIDDSIHSMKALDAAYRSASTGKQIRL